MWQQQNAHLPRWRAACVRRENERVAGFACVATLLPRVAQTGPGDATSMMCGVEAHEAEQRRLRVQPASQCASRQRQGSSVRGLISIAHTMTNTQHTNRTVEKRTERNRK